MIDPQLPGAWRLWQASFTTTNAALAKILADVTPATLLNPSTTLVGGTEVAIPGESGIRQQILRGGQRVYDGSISSTDSSNRSMQFFFGRETTLFADMVSGSITGTNTLNRTGGSFITDGWKVGDHAMFFSTNGVGITTAANEGIQGLVVTAVTALTLVFNGTLLTNESVAAGFRVFKVSRKTQRAIPLNAGNGDAIPPVQLLGGGQDPSAFPAPDIGWGLGAKDAIIVGMTAAISALPAQVDVNALAALY